jgi:hypothetical protein
MREEEKLAGDIYVNIAGMAPSNPPEVTLDVTHLG